MIDLKKMVPIGKVFFTSGQQVCGEYADRLMDDAKGHKIDFYFDTATGYLYAYKKGMPIEILASSTWRRIITEEQVKKAATENAYEETKRLRKELSLKGEKEVSPLAKAKAKIKAKKTKKA